MAIIIKEQIERGFLRGRKCTFCGGNPTAYWMGKTSANIVTTCTRCAVTVLPAFLADATHTDRCSIENGAERTLQETDAVFWKANSINLSNTVRQQAEEKDRGIRFNGQCDSCGKTVSWTEQCRNYDFCMDQQYISKKEVDNAGTRCSTCMKKYLNEWRKSNDLPYDPSPSLSTTNSKRARK